MNNKDEFNKQKNDLLLIIKNRLQCKSIEEIEMSSLNRLLKILNEYNYINRLEKKGLLTHITIDSLTLDYSISEKVILFDTNIT